MASFLANRLRHFVHWRLSSSRTVVRIRGVRRSQTLGSIQFRGTCGNGVRIGRIDGIMRRRRLKIRKARHKARTGCILGRFLSAVAVSGERSVAGPAGGGNPGPSCREERRSKGGEYEDMAKRRTCVEVGIRFARRIDHGR
jgi:hypothetical protein